MIPPSLLHLFALSPWYFKIVLCARAESTQTSSWVRTTFPIFKWRPAELASSVWRWGIVTVGVAAVGSAWLTSVTPRATLAGRWAPEQASADIVTKWSLPQTSRHERQPPPAEVRAHRCIVFQGRNSLTRGDPGDPQQRTVSILGLFNFPFTHIISRTKLTLKKECSSHFYSISFSCRMEVWPCRCRKPWQIWYGSHAWISHFPERWYIIFPS